MTFLDGPLIGFQIVAGFWNSFFESIGILSSLFLYFHLAAVLRRFSLPEKPEGRGV